MSSIWKHAADFGPFATIVAAIQTASALIRANAAQQNINRMKFETGGPVVGPRHSEGGISAELEGGEFIFSRKAVSAIGVNTLSSINRKLTFADGGIVPKNPFDSSRAPMSSNTFSGGASSSNLEAEMKALKNSFDSLSVNIQSWPRTLQVVNNVQDTMKQINVLNQLRNEADV